MNSKQKIIIYKKCFLNVKLEVRFQEQYPECICFLKLPCNKLPKTGQLRTMGICCFAVQEAKTLSSKCWQDQFLLRAMREKLLASFPASGGLLENFAFSDLQMHCFDLCLIFTWCQPVSVSVSKLPLFITDTPHIGLGSTLMILFYLLSL